MSGTTINERRNHKFERDKEEVYGREEMIKLYYDLKNKRSTLKTQATQVF